MAHRTTVLGKQPSMSANARRTEDSTATPDARRFTPVGAPAPMTDAKLAQCRTPRGEVDDDERAVYAVAHQHGIVQDERREDEYEAESILDLTADGKQAVERWVAGVDVDFGRVDRAFAVAVDDLEPAGDAPQRFAPIVQRHPEVDG